MNTTVTTAHTFGRVARTALTGLALAGLGLAAQPARAQSVLADSIFDYTQNIQAFNGWEYGYNRTDNSSPFLRYSNFGTLFGAASGPVGWYTPLNAFPNAYSTFLDQLGGRTASPSSNVDVYPVRRWTDTSYAGWAVVRGDYAHRSSFLSSLYTRATVVLRSSASGTGVPITVGGQSILISHLDNQIRPYAYLVKLAKNNVLDFTLDPFDNDNDDFARFTGVVDKNYAPVIYVPPVIKVGQTVSAYVKLPGMATDQTGPIAFTLSSSVAGVVSTEAGGSIGVGGTQGGFHVKGLSVLSATNVSVKATFPLLGNKTVSVSVKVVP